MCALCHFFTYQANAINLAHFQRLYIDFTKKALVYLEADFNNTVCLLELETIAINIIH